MLERGADLHMAQLMLLCVCVRACVQLTLAIFPMQRAIKSVQFHNIMALS